MSDLSRIVDVQIDVAQPVGRAGFGVFMIYSTFTNDNFGGSFGRAQTFDSLASMVSAGITDASPIYQAAESIFAQSPRPSYIVVGRRDGSETVAAAMLAIRAVNDDWYGFFDLDAQADATTATLQSNAEWAASADMPKLYFAQSDQAGILDPASTTDVAYILEAAARDRTVLLYRPTARLGDYSVCGWAASMLTRDIGGSTWAYKSIAGTSSDTLSPTARGAVHGKSANTYLRLRRDITEPGKVSSGEWIDVVVAIDWIAMRIQEDIFDAITAESGKLNFDSAGITSVGGIIQSRLERAASLGIVDASSIRVTIPEISQLEASDIAARILNGVSFTARITGAIHSVGIRGSLTYSA